MIRGFVLAVKVIHSNGRIQRGGMHELAEVEPCTRMHSLRHNVREAFREFVS